MRVQINQLEVLGKIETDGATPELVTSCCSGNSPGQGKLLEFCLETKPLDAEDTEVRLRLQIQPLEITYGAVSSVTSLCFSFHKYIYLSF